MCVYSQDLFTNKIEWRLEKYKILTAPRFLGLSTVTPCCFISVGATLEYDTS